MRFNHLPLSLAVIFITIIAVEGLPQSASPTASPQATASPAKKQPTKKKGWWLFGSSAKASPAKATATPSSSPVVEVGKSKKQKNTAAETATPIVVTASPRETVVKAALTPAPGGGNGPSLGQHLKSCLSLPEVSLVW